MSLLSSVGLRPQPIDEKALIILTNWPWLRLIRIRPEDIPDYGVWLGIDEHNAFEYCDEFRNLSRKGSRYRV
ncbi:MAG: hypothetical protein RXO23_08060 [Vulcanisaeta sp.]